MDVSHHFAVRYPDLAAFPNELDERISVHGLHLKTQKDVQIGERVGLQFRFPQREDPLRAVGVIAWVAPQPDASGKRSLVVRQISFDQESRDILELVRQTPVVAPAEAVPTPPPTPPTTPAPDATQQPTAATAPPPAAPPSVPQTPPPGPEATFTVPAPTEPAPADDTPQPRSRKGVWVLLLILLVGGGLAVWIFAFGGRQFIEVRFMSPPPAYNVALSTPLAEGVEPPVPGAPAPPPKPKPKPRPLVAVGFDYFQRPAVNEFIITFNRPPTKVITSRLPSPLMQTFYIDGARVRLDKEQYFLPFDYVRAVYFEHQDGVLRVSFVAQNPNYLPDPVWEQRGRELLIRFIATD